jgi:hypothetical protein
MPFNISLAGVGLFSLCLPYHVCYSPACRLSILVPSEIVSLHGVWDLVPSPPLGGPIPLRGRPSGSYPWSHISRVISRESYSDFLPDPDPDSDFPTRAPTWCPIARSHIPCSIFRSRVIFRVISRVIPGVIFRLFPRAFGRSVGRLGPMHRFYPIWILGPKVKES